MQRFKRSVFQLTVFLMAGLVTSVLAQDGNTGYLLTKFSGTFLLIGSIVELGKGEI
jgi:hypothetical protein